jgi:type I restriction enzyme R subunit
MSLLQRNHQWHSQLLNGIPVEAPGAEQHQATTLQLIDFANVQNNDWLVVHSFPVIEGDHQHCLDLVVFINGLPLAVFHGLHIGEEAWSLRAAYFQLQRYKAHLPYFFSLNELLVLTNGVQSKIGTLNASWRQFFPIQSINGEESLLPRQTEAEILIQDVFDKRRLLEIMQHFIVFHQNRTQLTKRLCTHSFCAVPLPQSMRQGQREIGFIRGRAMAIALEMS